ADATEYVVSIHFAEIFFTEAKKRILDVSAEGALIVDDLDIVQTAGANTKLVQRFAVTVTDGVLNLDFVPVKQNPKVSAIEVVEDIGQPLAPITALRGGTVDFGGAAVGSSTIPLELGLSNLGVDGTGTTGDALVVSS